ncbi:hypothetical protein [Adhaeretor mobilis]|uniref:Uncharacterized protein n=1 Tax=Adhaeretor mobilis TaxID=1930276 RepID=A0A517MW00_9BACT|nr:hypothetical protein [Adhaeretor mobilis]QDS99062.1 hypothetical protein HG15A2_23520 [Adhaeretor mobilis]
MKLEHDLQELIMATTLVLIEVQCIDHCISGSAILHKVLQENDFPEAYPLTVGVKIVNVSHTDTGIMLGKGTEPMPGMWPGHLVVVVPEYNDDDHLLIDLTLGQVNGKVEGIEVEPFVGKVDNNFIHGLLPARCTANGCKLTYEGFPNDDSFRTETNWSNVKGLDQAVEMVTERLS